MPWRREGKRGHGSDGSISGTRLRSEPRWWRATCLGVTVSPVFTAPRCHRILMLPHPPGATAPWQGWVLQGAGAGVGTVVWAPTGWGTRSVGRGIGTHKMEILRWAGAPQNISIHKMETPSVGRDTLGTWAPTRLGDPLAAGAPMEMGTPW